MRLTYRRREEGEAENNMQTLLSRRAESAGGG
jgi:hypothetical protein